MEIEFKYSHPNNGDKTNSNLVIQQPLDCKINEKYDIFYFFLKFNWTMNNFDSQEYYSIVIVIVCLPEKSISH